MLTSNKLSLVLIGIILSSTLWSVFQYIQLRFYTIETNPLAYALTGVITNVSGILGLYLAVVFVQYLHRPTLKDSHIIPLVLIGIIIGANLVHLFGGIFALIIVMNTASLVVVIMNSILLSTAVLLVHKEFNHTYDQELKPKQKKQMQLFQLGLYIILIGMVPVLIIQEIYGQQYLAVGFILLLISNSAVIIGYYLNDKIAFVLPQRTYLVIVGNSDGIEKYSHIFKGADANLELDRLGLVAGTLHAVVSIVADFTKQTSKPAMMDFENQNIIYSWHEEFFVATLSKYDSTIIREATNKLARLIRSEYGDDLTRVMRNNKHIKIDNLISECFSYVNYD